MTKKLFLLNLIEHIFNVDSSEVKYDASYNCGGGLTMNIPGVNGETWCFADYSKRTGKVSLKFKNNAFWEFSEARVQKIQDYLVSRGFSVKVEIFESPWIGGLTGYVCHAGHTNPKYLRIVFNDGYPWGRNNNDLQKVELTAANNIETNDDEADDLDVIKQSLIDIIGLSSDNILNLIANKSDSIMNDLATIRVKAKDAIEYINKYIK